VFRSIYCRVANREWVVLLWCVSSSDYVRWIPWITSWTISKW